MYGLQRGTARWAHRRTRILGKTASARPLLPRDHVSLHAHIVDRLTGAAGRARRGLQLVAGMGIMAGVFVTAETLMLLESVATRTIPSGPPPAP